jgi:16S rRNA (adenine1518-N6/adenine1519-N6)-dimethyltransferase
MSLLEKTKELCRLHEIRPERSKGQNFLINEEVYNKIVEAASLSKIDTVLEIGPGLGFLTAKIAAKAGRVIAVEIDDKLADFLKDDINKQDIKNIEVLNQDILRLDIEESFENYKIVANLPYNITSIFLRKFLSVRKKPAEMILMLQKEVAQRICTEPGDMSLLALGVQFYAKPEILFFVPRSDFYPVPEVDSAIIKLSIFSNQLSADKEKAFFRLAKIGFSSKRKMLKNNLSNGLHITGLEVEKFLSAVGIPLKARAQDLSLKDWLELSEEIQL